jgi:hypothetical protein
VQVLGEQNQSVPVLIVAPDREIPARAPEAKTANGKRYYNDEKSIRQYLSIEYDLPAPG